MDAQDMMAFYDFSRQINAAIDQRDKAIERLKKDLDSLISDLDYYRARYGDLNIKGDINGQ